MIWGYWKLRTQTWQTNVNVCFIYTSYKNFVFFLFYSHLLLVEVNGGAHTTYNLFSIWLSRIRFLPPVLCGFVVIFPLKLPWCGADAGKVKIDSESKVFVFLFVPVFFHRSPRIFLFSQIISRCCERYFYKCTTPPIVHIVAYGFLCTDKWTRTEYEWKYVVERVVKTYFGVSCTVNLPQSVVYARDFYQFIFRWVYACSLSVVNSTSSFFVAPLIRTKGSWLYGNDLSDLRKTQKIKSSSFFYSPHHTLFKCQTALHPLSIECNIHFSCMQMAIPK